MDKDLGVWYARLSKQTETEESMIRQEFDCNSKAVELGVSPVSFAEAKGNRSGRNEKNRPAWKQCSAFLKANHHRVKYFIVQDSDRVSRDVVTRLSFIRQLEAWGIEYISLLEPHLRQAMPEAERNLLHGVNAVVAQHYSDFLSEKQRNRIRSARERGGRVGPPPRGLKAVGRGGDRKFVQGDEKVYAVIIAMLEEFVNRTWGGDHMCDVLAAKGYKLPDRHGVWRPLQHSDWDSLRETLLFGDAYDSVVDPELMRRVRQRLAERSHRQANGGNRRGKKPPTVRVLQRLLFCDQCGARMWMHVQPYRPGQKKPAAKYRFKHHAYLHPLDTLDYVRHPLYPGECPHNGQYYPARPIEEQLWQELAQYFMFTPEQRSAIVDKMVSSYKPTSTQAQRDRLNARLKQVERTYTDPDNVNGALLSKSSYMEMRRDILDQLAAIPFDLGLSELSPETALQQLATVSDLLLNHTQQHACDVNHALHGILAKVFVDPEDGHITGYTPWGWCRTLFPEDKIK